MSLGDFDLKLPFPTDLLANASPPSGTMVQAEIYNGMVHGLLDFASLFGGATLLVRTAAVVGRLFVLGADVGHASTDAGSVLPDELVIQVGLLGFALYQVTRTAGPKIQAWLAPPLLTGADRYAYRTLFRPAGVTWYQYKQLSVNSMDWITVEPGHVIVDESEGASTGDSDSGNSSDNDAVYWLHQGDVQMVNTSNGDLMHKISSNQPKEVAGLGLLGEMKLARLVDHSSSTSPKRKKNASKNINNHAIKAVAGPSGATLLRMNTTKLGRLLRHDQELSSSVSRLAFKGMQDKLDALLLLGASGVSSGSAP